LSQAGSIFYGGIGSDLGEVTLIAAIVVAYRHHNCYVPRCPRLGHIDPEHGHPACKRHHSLRDKLVVPAPSSASPPAPRDIVRSG
jgi:hypothetical protein